MKKQFGEYRRLARGVFGCSSLWQGEDHLLYVRGSGFLIPFTEEYLRFRFRDIQALVIVGTSGRVVSAILYGIGAFLFGGMCAMILGLRESGETWPLVLTLVFPFPVAMLFLLLFVRTLILGQRCVVEVQTSLKKEKFRMLTRLPLARRVVGALDEVIRKAQEDLEMAGSSVLRQGTEGQGTDRDGGPRLSVPLPAIPAFAVSFILGALMLLQLHTENVAIAWATQLLGLVVAPLILSAIAASVRKLTTDGIRFALWGLAVSLLAIGGGAFIYLMSAALADPSITLSPVSYIESFAVLNNVTNLGFYLYFLIAGFAMVLLSIIGLLQVLSWRKASKD